MKEKSILAIGIGEPTKHNCPNCKCGMEEGSEKGNKDDWADNDLSDRYSEYKEDDEETLELARALSKMINKSNK
jgi:hypothetical protein